MKTIKCNPSWTACTRMLLEVVKHGDTEQARENAADEILRGMTGYDAMLAKHTDYFEMTESEVCDHVYADDGDPRCINCNAPAVTS